jgi:hypothetical protein
MNYCVSSKADASKFLVGTRKISGEAVGEKIFIEEADRAQVRRLGEISQKEIWHLKRDQMPYFNFKNQILFVSREIWQSLFNKIFDASALNVARGRGAYCAFGVELRVKRQTSATRLPRPTLPSTLAPAVANLPPSACGKTFPGFKNSSLKRWLYGTSDSARTRN